MPELFVRNFNNIGCISLMFRSCIQVKITSFKVYGAEGAFTIIIFVRTDNFYELPPALFYNKDILCITGKVR
jgi:hypothetical protein